MTDVVIVAGETSGDQLAADLVERVCAVAPEIRFHGVAGPRMRAAGVQTWIDSETLAVRGYAEVVGALPRIFRAKRELIERTQALKPALYIGVDAPDFNLGLETALKAQGIPTVHFVCPSIWAWRADRVEKIRRAADHVLCIFPFEPALLAQHGIAATYVGHPLANVIPLEPDRAAARLKLGLAPDARVVAILPGSRKSEVEYLALRFFQAAALMQQAYPAMQFIVPAVPTLRARIEALAAEAGMAGRIQIVPGQSHTVLAACDATLIASGTATLEAALFKRPMVIGYRMHALSWQLMKRLRYQPWVGLPNILSRDFVVPELIQEDCQPAALAAATLRWLDDNAAAAALTRRFDDLHHSLRRDTARCAADVLAQVLQA